MEITMKKKNPWKAVTAILCIFTLLLLVAIPVTSYYATMINAAAMWVITAKKNKAAKAAN